MKNLEGKFSVSGDSMVTGAADFYSIATDTPDKRSAGSESKERCFLRCRSVSLSIVIRVSWQQGYSLELQISILFF
jgi:hypothetical protein